MLDIWRDFQRKVSAANPAPYNETPQYKDFMMWFPPLSLAVFVACSYFLTATFGNALGRIAEFDAPHFRVFGERIAFLGGPESCSSKAFISTIATAILLTPILLVLHLRGYLRAHSGGWNYKPLTMLTLVYLMQGMVLFGIFFWIAFIDVPKSAGVANVGAGGIFFWPIFPVLGSTLLWMLEGWICCAIIGLVKLVHTMATKMT